MGVGGIVQWRIVVKDGRIVEVAEVVGGEVVVYCSCASGRHTIPFLKRYRVASLTSCSVGTEHLCVCVCVCVCVCACACVCVCVEGSETERPINQ